MAHHLSGGRWHWPAHLDLLSQSIADAALAGGGRKIVTMPPRHGKSELVSLWTPVWYLDHWPGRRVMHATYSADFGATWGRRVRNLVDEHAAHLRVRLSHDSKAADAWDTTAGGYMVTGGVGGPFTGRGADLLIIDDPIKNAEEARSAVVRESVWDWWTSTMRTRLEPGATAIIVMTRWHDDDLVGRLIRSAERDGAEPWDVINFPAIAEEHDVLGRAPGDALWRERYDEQAMDRIRRSVGRKVWASLYQQRPVPAEGGMLSADWFEVVDVLPRIGITRQVRYWDFAATEAKRGAKPDWTAGAKLALHTSGVVYISDIRRFQGTPGQVERTVLQCAAMDGRGVAIRLEQEPGSSGKMVVDTFRRKLRGYDFQGIRPSGDKSTRAEPMSADAEAGNIKLLRGDWIQAFLDEASTFPNGAHDDQVDAVVGAWEQLVGRSGGWTDDRLRELMDDEQDDDSGNWREHDTLYDEIPA